MCVGGDVSVSYKHLTQSLAEPEGWAPRFWGSGLLLGGCPLHFSPTAFSLCAAHDLNPEPHCNASESFTQAVHALAKGQNRLTRQKGAGKLHGCTKKTYLVMLYLPEK